jgi:uncharacterized protein (TIGR00730 family)
MMMRSITVFCGSREGKDPLFVQHARELGRLMASLGIRLIYGGGNRGLMGALAEGLLSGGGLVTGVIPRVLLEWEAQHTGLTELIITDGMHERKKLLYQLCEAAIVLPGGFGTLDEMFEMLTWNQLSIHDKRIHILNTSGFYDHLYRHMMGLEEQGFLYDKLDERISLSPDPGVLVETLLKK